MPSTRVVLSKREFVHETLRAEIIGGARRPGERLVIDDIAAELAVSPIPVREALQQLQADSLVVIEPYVGARVSQIHVGLIEEVFALLEALEIISSQHACQRMDDADFAHLRALLLHMDDCLDDLDAWSDANVAFHQYVVDKADLALVPAMMSQVLDQWQRFRRHYLDDVFAGRAAEAQREHWQLYEALRTRDPEHVRTVIQAHNKLALDAYRQYLNQNGQFRATDPIKASNDSGEEMIGHG
jgi:DNA-binding GntR family transcriptional regulator